MKKSVILTTQGSLGCEMANLSHEFNIESTLCYVNASDATHAFDNFSQFDYVVWNTGYFLQKPFSETTDHEFDTLIDVHLTRPLKILREIHKNINKAYHLIVVASCSSWKLRHQEAFYCALSAAKATFARNFANDLLHLSTENKVSLVNPGGLKTPFLYEVDNFDRGNFLDSDQLSRYIWQAALNQNCVFQEVQYLRKSSEASVDESPMIELAVRLPQIVTQ